MAEVSSVKLRDFGGPIYVGRPKGEAARKLLGLDSLEKSCGRISVVVPSDAYAINSSFLLGMIGPAIKRAGNRDAFFSLYAFEASPEQYDAFLTAALEDAVSHALVENKPLPGKRRR